MPPVGRTRRTKVSTTTMAATRGSGRRECGRSITRAAPMLAVIIAAFCVEAMAGPERDGLSPIEGRWVAEKRSLTLDLVRCGASWCGVEVKDGKTCGAV